MKLYAVVRQWQTSGGLVRRIVVGPYRSRAAAQAAIDRHIREYGEERRSQFAVALFRHPNRNENRLLTPGEAEAAD